MGKATDVVQSDLHPSATDVGAAGYLNKADFTVEFAKHLVEKEKITDKGVLQAKLLNGLRVFDKRIKDIAEQGEKTKADPAELAQNEKKEKPSSGLGAMLMDGIGIALGFAGDLLGKIWDFLKHHQVFGIADKLEGMFSSPKKPEDEQKEAAAGAAKALSNANIVVTEDSFRFQPKIDVYTAYERMLNASPAGTSTGAPISNEQIVDQIVHGLPEAATKPKDSPGTAPTKP